MKYLGIVTTGIKILLICYLLFFGVNSMRVAWVGANNIGDTGSEQLDRWEADMQLVREVLPLDRGIVGYISEEDVPGAEYAYWDVETEFLLSQYALAPLILKKGPVAEWNVIVLKAEDLNTWLQANPGQYEITNITGKFNILHVMGAP